MHPDPHKEAILHLYSVSRAIGDEAALRRPGNGVLGIDRLQSRLEASKCEEMLRDIVAFRDVTTISEGAMTWPTFDAGISLPNLDPNFKDWKIDDRRQVIGYVVVRWRGSETLLVRVRRVCAGDQPAECKQLVLSNLGVHDQMGPPIACVAVSIGERYWPGWRGQISPIYIAAPGGE